MKRLSFAAILVALLVVPLAPAQQSAPSTSVPPAAKPLSPEFLSAADEVLDEVSKIVALPVKFPLKKSIRTREEIREYVIKEIRSDREPQKWYADQKALERFGLIPRDFPLEDFLVGLLTEQIAGLYDPKTREFFIADHVGIAELRIVMAHELVHALQDQNFEIEKWVKAARPNDDAMSARHAVLEGSAFAGMMDWSFRNQNVTTRDLPSLEPLIRSQMVSEFDKNSQMGKAPLFIRDSLLFPYLAGTNFAQSLLKNGQGWTDFYAVFQKPPGSTHHVLHPDLYLKGETTPPVALPDASKLQRSPWKKLDENVMGEFGLAGILKQLLTPERAERLSPSWAGDLYGVYEHSKSKQILLLFRLRLSSADDAARFFGSYSEALERKYEKRENLFRRPNFFSFDTSDGGAFLYCHADECFTAEGASRAEFEQLVRAMKWPAAPAQSTRAPAAKVAWQPVRVAPSTAGVVSPE